MRLRFELDASQWQAELEALGGRFEREALFKRLAALLREDFLRQFQEGGDPVWAPLSPHTVRKKASAGYPRVSRTGAPPANLVQRGLFGPSNVLMMTGALMASWTQEGAPGAVERVDGDVLEIGSDLAYAATHQFGDRRLAWGRILATIPARPLRVREEVLEAALDGQPA